MTTVLAAACLTGSPIGAAPSTDPASYVLIAGEELNARHLVVESGDVSAGTIRSLNGIDAPSSRLAADLVDIHPRSRCTELAASAVVDSGSGCGPAIGLASPLFPDLVAACGFPEPPTPCDPGRPVSVGHRRTQTLAPGVYGDLHVAGGSPGRGTLILEGGEYVFCRLHLGPRAQLRLRQPTTIEIATRANFGLGSDTGPAPGSRLEPGDIAVFVAGERARLQRRADFLGMLCAPNGTLDLMHGSRLEGRGVARAVRTGRVSVRGVDGPQTTTSTSTSTTTTGGGATSTSSTSSTSVPGSCTTSTIDPGATTSTSTSSTTSTTLGASAVCGGDGLVDATVEVAYPESSAPPSVLRVRLSYPGFLEVPGSLDGPEVQAAVTDLTGLGILVVNDDDTASALSVGYLDFDTVTTPNLMVGALFDVRLENCPVDTFVASDAFACEVVEAGGTLGEPLPDVTCRILSLAASGAPPTTTTTIASPTTSSTVAAPTTSSTIATPTTSSTVATPTSSSSTFPTSSTVTATTSTTSSTAGASVCGNGMTEGSETCDDGNVVNTDACPADCTVDPCDQTQEAAVVLSVSLDNAQGNTFGVGTVFIDYPEGLVFVPGSADDAQVQAAVTGRPTSGGPTCLVNDRDHGLQFGCFSFAGGFPDGAFFQVAFRDCQSPTTPSLDQFTCAIIEAADGLGSPVSATCSLALQ